jgi:hypothetical protein
LYQALIRWIGASSVKRAGAAPSTSGPRPNSSFGGDSRGAGVGGAGVANSVVGAGVAGTGEAGGIAVALGTGAEGSLGIGVAVSRGDVTGTGDAALEGLTLIADTTVNVAATTRVRATFDFVGRPPPVELTSMAATVWAPVDALGMVNAAVNRP